MPSVQLPGQNFLLDLVIQGQRYTGANVLNLVIREWVIDILPRLELTYVDDGTMIERLPLEDNDEIKVTIGKSDQDKNALTMTFLLSDYKVNQVSDNKQIVVEMSGHLKVSSMFTPSHSRSFRKQNSVSVLKTISEEVDLPFTNPLNVIPTDTMTWLQCSNNYKFIRHILNRASISDDLPIFYANSKSKFVYTSLHAEMNKKESRIAKLDQVMFENEIDDKDKTIWYNQYDIVNFNGYYNKTTGYGGSYEYYDLNGSEKTGSVSTPEKLTQLSFTDKEYAGQDVFSESGHFYTENVYGGYFESLARNPFLLNNFFAFSLVINVDARNDINLFDKINLSVPSNFDDGPNKVMSGNYLVGGITHQVSKDGIYKKMVSLHRNGMNKSQDVKQYRVTE